MRGVVRTLAALLCVALALLCCAAGTAEASLGAYRLRRLPDGALCYVFDEVSVTVPASWTGKIAVLEYGGWAAFCHEPSNRMWRQENSDETGGLLFALCVDGTADFLEDPALLELGRTDRGYYYLRFPTDLQAYPGDEAVVREYEGMWKEIDYVRENAEVLAFHAGPQDLGKTVTAEALRQVAFDEAGAPYDGEWVPFEDGFRLYVPSAWQTFDLTGAESAAGIFYRAGDGSVGVAVSYQSAGALQSREELAMDLERAGFVGIERLALNGIEAVGFERPADGYRGVAFFHPSVPGYILLIYTAPLGGAGSQWEAVSRAMLDSVSPYPAN